MSSKMILLLLYDVAGIRYLRLLFNDGEVIVFTLQMLHGYVRLIAVKLNSFPVKGVVELIGRVFGDSTHFFLKLHSLVWF